MLKFLKIFVPALGGTGAGLASAYILADQFVVEIPAPLRGSLIQPAMADETDTAETETLAILFPDGGYGLGRDATAQEVIAWDIDVRPDGVGLPVGSGDVWTGEEVFVEKCAVCHGDFGEAVGRWPVLAGGQNTLTREDPVKTIGSYWPYLSTVYDYVNRAMPFGEAQSLEPDEIYAITAYLLYVNDMVEDDFELSNENFLSVEMPNVDNFYMDDRAETELTVFSGEACMTDCKSEVEITMNASVLDVTPQDDTDDEPAAEMEVAEAETAPEAEVEEGAVEVAAVDPALIEQGEGVFRQCTSCHQIGDGARNGAGPHLNGILGRVAGSVDGFRYSPAITDAAEAGLVWDEAELAAFLADPRGYMDGTRMAFRGIRTQEDIDAIVAYLGTLGE